MAPNKQTQQRAIARNSIRGSNWKLVYLIAFVTLALLLNVNLMPQSGSNMLVAANKKSDILFLKGKFILKDKKGSIVISDDCPGSFGR